VLRYGEAAAYDIVWADALLIEEAALGGHVIAGSVKAKAAPKAKKKAAGRAVAKTAARAKTAAKKPAAKKATKPAKAKKKGGDNA
jgi:hypothetical protein